MNLHEELISRTGFSLPAPFVTVITAFVQRVGNVDGGIELFEEYVGARICNAKTMRYESTPVEFVPILDTGGDGVAYGYVLHAPELNPSDFAMGVFGPTDGEVVHIGNSTLVGVENLISWTHADALESAIDLEFLRRLGIAPSPEKKREVWKLEGESFVSPKPDLPAGWRHAMTSDGVGVAAEDRHFRRAEVQRPPTDWPVEQYLAQSRTEANEGFLGDALVTLKEAWWCKYNSGEPLNALKAALADAYLAIGKPALRDALEAYFNWDLDEDARMKAMLWGRRRP